MSCLSAGLDAEPSTIPCVTFHVENLNSALDVFCFKLDRQFCVMFSEIKTVIPSPPLSIILSELSVYLQECYNGRGIAPA